MDKEMENKRITEKIWFIILMIILFFPYGLYLMWKNKKFKLTNRILITSLYVFFIIGIFDNRIENKKNNPSKNIRFNTSNNRINNTNNTNNIKKENTNNKKIDNTNNTNVDNTNNNKIDNKNNNNIDNKSDKNKYKKNKVNEKNYILEYGVLGDFGKEVEFDGDKYIYYYLPKGKYRIIDKSSKVNKIYIVSDSTHLNSDGFLEDNYSSEIDLKNTKVIEIKDGEHIELTLTTTIKLKRMEK